MFVTGPPTYRRNDDTIDASVKHLADEIRVPVSFADEWQTLGKFHPELLKDGWFAQQIFPIDGEAAIWHEEIDTPLDFPTEYTDQIHTWLCKNEPILMLPVDDPKRLYHALVHEVKEGLENDLSNGRSESLDNLLNQQTVETLRGLLPEDQAVWYEKAQKD